MSENKECCSDGTTKKKILLVDDDKDFVESNKELLEAEGFDIFVAYNGSEGLEMAKKVRPDLMVLDVMMATNTEGFEVSRKIPETPELKNMPILLVTGIRKEMNLPFGFEPDKTWLPVDSVMEKPIDPAKFVEAVKNKVC